MRLIDLTGMEFGRFTVLKEAGRTKNKKVLWLCSCKCGAELLVIGSELKRGSTKSCGCLKKEVTSRTMTTHGCSNHGKNTSEYIAWQNIKDRCYNLKNKRYYDWGGRGITVCERWLNSFKNFLEDMGEKPSPKYSIDRKDNNGNYCPENCKWATALEQAKNKRKKIKSS